MKSIIKIIVCGITLAASVANSSPWFTGPLLAPAGSTIPGGHINIEPYAFYTDSFGIYDSNRRVVGVPDTHTVNISPIISIGLNDFMDIQGSFPYNYNTKQRVDASGLGDVGITLGFQALRQHGKWIPDLRVTIGETVPTGDYQNLNPMNLGLDGNGSGSYQTTFALNFQRVDYFIKEHALRTRLSFSGTLAKKTNIQGFNSYGGGIGTRGTIRPGDQFQADLAFEYHLTQNWVPVFEVNYTTRQRSSFSGQSGFNADGTVATVGHGELDQLSLAPAIEYNFNGNLGIIGGVWFTVKGRDASDFVSGVIAVNYYI